MKRFLCLLISVFLVMAACMPAAYAKNNVQSNGRFSYDKSRLLDELNYWKNMFKQNHKNKGNRAEYLQKIKEVREQLGSAESEDQDKTNINLYNCTIIFYNGDEIQTDVPPVLKYGRMLVPVRALTTAMGADVKWDPSTATVTITKDGTVIKLKLGSSKVLVNGKEYTIDVPAENINSRVVVPVRFIAEMFNLEVTWDEETGTIIIDKGDGDAITPPSENEPVTSIVNDNTKGTGLGQFEYAGNWSYSHKTGAYSNDYHLSNETNAYYQVRFYGTQLNLYGAKGPDFGIARVTIDGQDGVNIDCYKSTRAYGVLLYESPVLENGQHILKVVVTGNKNSSSSNDYICADKVEILTDDTVIPPEDGTTTGTLNDNTTGTSLNQFRYVGSWLYGYQTGAYNNDNHWSSTKDSYYQVKFDGTQVKIYAAKDPGFGIAAVSIDGGTESTIDCYAASRADNVLLYQSPVLSHGQHTLKVRVTGDKNSHSSGSYINADRVDVIDGIQSDSNLALNKPIEASSIYDSSMAAYKAVDGDTGTRWSSQFSDSQWISLDLGTQFSIGRVKLVWELAYGKAYKIQVSSDGTHWSNVYSTTSGDGGTDDVTFTPVNARYVRVYGVQRATNYGYSLWELEVYSH